jgi:mono/diheme cytochrome c family protein
VFLRHSIFLSGTFVALLFGAFGASPLLPQTAPPSQDSYVAKIQPLLGKYCYKCHGPQLKPKADLNLTKYGSESAIRENRKIWKEVLTKTLVKEMPPEDFQPQPTQEERDTLSRFIAAALDRIDPGAPKVAGRVVSHRLNRIEYKNTIRDLLGVDYNPFNDFPHDDVGYGFDNIGDVLSMPPLLLEKYVAAAKKIADQAVTGKEKDRLIFTSKPGAAADASAPPGAKPKTNRDFAKECLTKLGTRAFRRMIQSDEIERLLKLYDVGEKMEGGDFEKSMKLPIRGLLSSPYFLLRIEAEGFADTYPLAPFELASRLSYFLWSSMPDDELLESAKTGKILNLKELEAQTTRLLKDPKAFALADNFTPQWLQIRRLEDMKFDAARFPSADAQMRKDMIQETVLFFEAVQKEDLSVLTFLDSDFTFVNDRLARLYGLAGGGSFQKVKLSDPKRGGVLTMAAVLAATSDPDRTSLVKRGKWVLETILATPPPPPVPDAANLKDDPEAARLPLRQRMEKHRTDPNCASCHKRMDPIGFGFENYDAIGAWRDQDQGKPVDSAAELPDGKKFNGPVELKKILKERKGEFLEGFTEKLLTYALGRGVEPFDGPVVKSIADSVTRKEYKFSALIFEIVKSYPFMYRQKDRGKK